MPYKITYRASELDAKISIPGSKSISNRLLILKYLLNAKTEIINISTSNDTKVLMDALESKGNVIDVEDAGTSFRFLTAYLALRTKFPVILTGSNRMKERPIKQLVDMLIQLGANIEYLDKEGYPAILIKPSDMAGGYCDVPNGEIISSQYISALMMIGPFMKNGLQLRASKRVSESYMYMTASLMSSIGFNIEIDKEKIVVGTEKPISLNEKWIVESDWSSASYWYEIMALSTGGRIELSTLIGDSLQGDSMIAGLMNNFVDSHFNDTSVILQKTDEKYFGKIQLQKHGEWCPIIDMSYNLGNTPDLAQTIASTFIGLGIRVHLNELGTLKIKECDRISALQSELAKFGVKISANDNSLSTDIINLSYHNEVVNTFNDHRMIMSIIPLAMVFPNGILIDEISHIKKSYPSFIEDIQTVGFDVQEIEN